MEEGYGSRWGTLAALAVATLAVLGAACGSDPPAAAARPTPPPIIDPGVLTSGRPVPARGSPRHRGSLARRELRLRGGERDPRGWIVGVTTDGPERWIATSARLPRDAGRRAVAVRRAKRSTRRRAHTRSAGLGGIATTCRSPTAPCTGEARGRQRQRIAASSAAGQEVVGYQGGHTRDLLCSGGPDGCDPLRHSGKIDRVRLNGDGSISVVRFDWFLNHHDLGYWYNRTAYRLAYDHFTNPGTLYAGSDHGVIIFFPNRWVPYTGVGPAGLDDWMDDIAGDHLHAQVCVGIPCSAGGHPTAGHWRGSGSIRRGGSGTPVSPPRASRPGLRSGELVGPLGRRVRALVRRSVHVRARVRLPERAGVQGPARGRSGEPHRRLDVPGRPHLVRERGPDGGDRDGRGLRRDDLLVPHLRRAGARPGRARGGGPRLPAGRPHRPRGPHLRRRGVRSEDQHVEAARRAPPRFA
jgi:hypothetical protein